MNRFTDLLNGLSRPVRERFCSTFGIVNAAVGAAIAGDTWDGVPSYRNQFADNDLNGAATFVGCTSVFSTGFGVRAVRALIWMKNYKTGVASGGMIFQLQVATSSSAFSATGSSTGTSVIAQYQAARATSCLMMNGVTPDNLPYAYARIAVFPVPFGTASTDTASFDCNIDAT